MPNRLHHLTQFHSVYVTLEFAQSLKLPLNVTEVACRLTLLDGPSSSNGEPPTATTTPFYTAEEPSLPLDRRIALPYAAQRQLEFALVDKANAVLGRYALMLSPFSSARKSLAAKMRLKHPDTQSEVGYLNVKVKLCIDPPPALLPETELAHSLAAKYQSLHVCFRRFLNVPEQRYFKPEERVYASVLLSSFSRRTSLKAVQDGRIAFDSTLQFPYKGERQFAVALHATERFKADRRLLTYRLDVLALRISAQPKRLSLPAKATDSNAPAGDLTLDVLLSTEVVPKPVRLEGAAAFIQTALENSSQAAQDSRNCSTKVDLREDLPLSKELAQIGTLLLVIHHITIVKCELPQSSAVLVIHVGDLTATATPRKIEEDVALYDKAFAFPGNAIKRFCLLMMDSGYSYAIDMKEFCCVCRGNVLEAAGTLHPPPPPADNETNIARKEEVLNKDHEDLDHDNDDDDDDYQNGQRLKEDVQPPAPPGKVFFRLEKRCCKVERVTVVNNWENW